ncbi:Leukocyte receptor cluster member 8 [Schistosoma japonicum]|nr:Leukocyte receptor cluster member 8 [Schistosoma japonicum]
MAQWGSYNPYWQGTYPPFYDYTQPAQTYDYNHQTIPVSSIQGKPGTPPPPGVESAVPKTDGTVTATTSVPPAYDPSWSTSTPFHSQNFTYSYPYSPAVPSRQPAMFDVSPHRPMMPNIAYTPYGSPQFPLHAQGQFGCNWNTTRPTYSYPVNGGSVQSFGMWSDGRLPIPSNGVTMSGPRFPFQNTLDSPNSVPSENTANTPISKEALQQPPASFQDKGVKEQWSDELKEYVQRAFCSIDTSEEKDQMERILKEKLEYIFRNNIKVDWKTENIPTIPSRAIASFRKSFNIRGNSVNAPQPITRGNPKGRRRRRGGASNIDSNTDMNTSSEDGGVRGRGRGNWCGKRGSVSKQTPPNESRLTQRASRFKDHLAQSSAIGSGSIAQTTSQLLSSFTDERDGLAVDFSSCQIVGTMQEIEKQYLRLTRAPDPTEVRPLAVLKLSLQHVKEKWHSNTDYHWVCEQFKSIRQDLTVQGIEDDFAVSVYEAHADVALDAGDFEEFHQCQSQLLRLHKEGLGVGRLLEFTAYRLLYYIFTLDILGINTIMAGLRPTHKTNPCIAFALKLRSAWSLSNYHRFFQLLYPATEDQQPPLRCKHVVNWFVDRERKEAIRLTFKVFRPTISLSFLSKLVGFSSTALCKDFICKEFSLPETSLEPIEKIDTKVVWNLMCSQSS